MKTRFYSSILLISLMAIAQGALAEEHLTSKFNVTVSFKENYNAPENQIAVNQGILNQTLDCKQSELEMNNQKLNDTGMCAIPFGKVVKDTVIHEHSKAWIRRVVNDSWLGSGELDDYPKNVDKHCGNSGFALAGSLPPEQLRLFLRSVELSQGISLSRSDYESLADHVVQNMPPYGHDFELRAVGNCTKEIVLNLPTGTGGQFIVHFQQLGTKKN